MTFNSSIVINYSPRKARLVLNAIRGLSVQKALISLTIIQKKSTKNVYNLLLNAANNLSLTEADYSGYKVATIVAEEAQKLVRTMPRARGSANRIKRRYSRIKVVLEKI
jgi:large subunit ribosomal protein L22